ncbi:MAG: L,D-transpeptidase family protein [Pseudomonadota bacterium]|nr:L,D-transpeptidase family protein [Pseudomonadota bacterium]
MAVALLVASAVAVTAWLGGRRPPVSLPAADWVVVVKSARTLSLLRDGQVIKTYPVALGRNPVGHKIREGDGRTPEGRYVLDWRNPNSRFHLSLHISYPNAADRRHAQALGVSPGGDIMIHGQPNGLGWLGIMPQRDWTEGCIAVTNSAMEEIWAAVAEGTPIDILP